MSQLAALEPASLSEPDARMVESFVLSLAEALGERLLSVWLYGSRARGEEPRDESDVDVMVVTVDGDADRELVDEVSLRAAVDQGLSPFRLSVQLFDPAWIAGRREIRSFYMAEVDRDKLVPHGER